jgi:hypothetical protein
MKIENTFENTLKNLTSKEQKLKTFVLSKIARLTSPKFVDDIKDASMTITITGFTYVDVIIGHRYNKGSTCCPISVRGWIFNKDEKQQILEDIGMFIENPPLRASKVFDFANTPSATSSSMIINYLKNKRDEKEEQIVEKLPQIAHLMNVHTIHTPKLNASYTIEINIIYYAKAHNGLDIDGGLIKKYRLIENLIKSHVSEGVDPESGIIKGLEKQKSLIGFNSESVESDIIKALEQETSLIGFNSNLISELKGKKITIPYEDRIFSPSEHMLIAKQELSRFISIQESDQKLSQELDEEPDWFISIQKSELDAVLYSVIGNSDEQ